MSSHFPTGMITQTNVSDTYRYAFSSGDDGYVYIDNVNLSTDEVTRLQFSKNGALDLLTINDGDLNYIGHFISNADLDGVLETTPGGSTAIQSGTGDVKYRLQLNPSGNVVLYQSTDGGVTWPNTKNVFSFN